MFKIVKALRLWFLELTLEEKKIVIDYYNINKEIKSMATKLSDVLAELIKRASAHDELAKKEAELQKTVGELTVEVTSKSNRLAELEPLALELEKAGTDLGIESPVGDGSNIVPPTPEHPAQ